MKQNSCVFDQPIHSIQLNRINNNRQDKPPQKVLPSPRFITRKKDKKQNPLNPFARRKQKEDLNQVFRYLSPKRYKNQQQYSFISDEVCSQSSNDNLSQRSMFDLNFSRINYQKIDENRKQLSCAKKLFDDINNSSEIQENSQVSMIKKQRNNKQQGQEKTGISMQTMEQSPHGKRVKNLELKVRKLSQQNELQRTEIQTLTLDKKRIKAELQKIGNQKDSLAEKNNELQQKIVEHKIQMQNIQQKLKLFYQQQIQLHLYKLNQLQTRFDQLQTKLKQTQALLKQQHSQKQQISCHCIQLQSNSQLFINQLKLKQAEALQFQNQLSSLKLQNSDKFQYSKCLEDAILQLNQKIYSLKTQNQNLQQIHQQLLSFKDIYSELQFIVDQKSYQLQKIEFQLQDCKKELYIYQFQVAQCHTKITQYQFQKAKYLKRQDLDVMKQKVLDQSEKIQIIYKKQIELIQQILREEKQINQKLRKELSYKELQINLQKRQQYDRQSTSRQIQNLKNRNKKLMKKLNEQMQKNSQLIEKIEKKKKLQVKNKNNKNSEKRQISNERRFEGQGQINAQEQKQINIQKSKHKNLLKNLLVKFYDDENQQASSSKSLTDNNIHNRINNLKEKVISDFKRQTHLLKRSSQIDSDDQLSFKLSPQKK